jgi:hypothetical protein
MSELARGYYLQTRTIQCASFLATNLPFYFLWLVLIPLFLRSAFDQGDFERTLWFCKLLSFLLPVSLDSLVTRWCRRRVLRRVDSPCRVERTLVACAMRGVARLPDLGGHHEAEYYSDTCGDFEC